MAAMQRSLVGSPAWGLLRIQQLQALVLPAELQQASVPAPEQLLLALHLLHQAEAAATQQLLLQPAAC
jgi:hypothetical protein